MYEVWKCSIFVLFRNLKYPKCPALGYLVFSFLVFLLQLFPEMGTSDVTQKPRMKRKVWRTFVAVVVLDGGLGKRLLHFDQFLFLCGGFAFDAFTFLGKVIRQSLVNDNLVMINASKVKKKQAWSSSLIRKDTYFKPAIELLNVIIYGKWSVLSNFNNI